MSTACLRSTFHLTGRCRQTSGRRSMSLGCSRNDDTYFIRPPLERPRHAAHLIHSPSRAFSSSPPWRSPGHAMPVTRRAATPSLKVAQKAAEKQMLRQGTMPDDIGLLPETFIMPRPLNRPGWFSHFKARRRLEWTRLRTRLREVVSAIMYRYLLVRPRPRLHMGRISGLAKELHEQMYACFARGDLGPVEGKVCKGLLGSLQKRVKLRPPNTALKWTLHKHVRRPKLVSYKAALLPKQKGETGRDANGLVQAVVRIHSLQSLQHVRRDASRNASGQLVVKEVLLDSQGRDMSEPLEKEDGVPKGAKESIEYFVVQRSLRKGKEGPWMVWGTAEETTLKSLRSKKDKARKA